MSIHRQKKSGRDISAAYSIKTLVLLEESELNLNNN